MTGFLVDQLDTMVLSSALLGFSIFLVTHVIALRAFRSKRVPGLLVGCVALGEAGNAGSYLGFVGGRGSTLTDEWGLVAGGGLVSILIFSLLIFHYFNWVFGMGEAAIRIRLLRELNERPSRLAAFNEIIQSYNDSIILRLRLERLVAGGHLKRNGEFYCIGNRILFVQIGIQKIAKRWFR